MVYLAWRYGNADVFALYNGLDDSYRPLGPPDARPRPPRFSSRLRHFVYGCGLFAADQETELAGGRQQGAVSRALGGGRR